MDSSKSHLVAILVALIGAGALIIAAIITAQPTQEKAEVAKTQVALSVTQTALANFTALPVQNLTATTLPTFTPTPMETPIPSSTMRLTQTGIPSSLLFEENFESGKTRGVTYISGDWRVIADENGNRVYDIDNTAGVGFPGVDFGSHSWKNYVIEYRVRVLKSSPSSGSWVILAFRKGADAAESYIVSIQPSVINLAVILQHSPWRNLTAREFNFSPEVWHSVRIEAQRADIKVSIDNFVVFDTTDTKISVGGLNFQVGPNTHAQFDDIRVTALES